MNFLKIFLILCITYSCTSVKYPSSRGVAQEDKASEEITSKKTYFAESRDIKDLHFLLEEFFISSNKKSVNVGDFHKFFISLEKKEREIILEELIMIKKLDKLADERVELLQDSSVYTNLKATRAGDLYNLLGLSHFALENNLSPFDVQSKKKLYINQDALYLGYTPLHYNLTVSKYLKDIAKLKRELANFSIIVKTYNVLTNKKITNVNYSYWDLVPFEKENGELKVGNKELKDYFFEQNSFKITADSQNYVSSSISIIPELLKYKGENVYKIGLLPSGLSAKNIAELQKYEESPALAKLEETIKEYEKVSLINFSDIDKNMAFIVDGSASVDYVLPVIVNELKLMCELMLPEKLLSIYGMGSSRSIVYLENVKSKEKDKVHASIRKFNGYHEGDDLRYSLRQALENSKVQVINILSDAEFEDDPTFLLNELKEKFSKRLETVQINNFIFNGSSNIYTEFMKTMGGVEGVSKVSKGLSSEMSDKVLKQVKEMRSEMERYNKRKADLKRYGVSSIKELLENIEESAITFKGTATGHLINTLLDDIYKEIEIIKSKK